MNDQLPTSVRAEPRTRKRRFQSLRDSALLTASSYAQYLIPLVTLPLVARSLGADGFGFAAVATATYFFGAVLVDFGISLPLAARVMAEVDDEGVLRSRYAKFRLAIFGILVSTTAGVYLFGAPYTIKIACLGAVAGGASALSEVWVLVSHRQFGRVVVAEWSGRILYLATLIGGLFMFPSPACVPVALFIGAVATTVASRLLAGTVGAPVRARGAIGTREMLFLGAPAAAGRVLVTAYGQGASVLYATALTPASVGLYSAGDKVVRAAQGLANPVSLAVFPKFSVQRADIRSLAAHVKRYTLWSVAISLLGSIALAVLASPVAGLLYGSEFSGSADLMRLQAFLLPFAVGCTMLVTNFFNVTGDTRAVFVTTTVGIGVTLLALVAAHRTGSLLVLAGGSVVAEASAFFVAWTRVAKAVEHICRQPTDVDDSHGNLDV